MSSFLPSFQWDAVVIQPWTSGFSITLWVVLMGFLSGAACALVGNYLLLRRMALLGDAISHSVLPGLVVAFFLFQTTGTIAAFSGALAAAVLTVLLIDGIHRYSKIKVDAAICIVFTTLFAVGVVGMSFLERSGNVHLDAECILYGEILMVALEPPVVVGGVSLGPPQVLRIALVLAGVLLATAVFYKELLITSFDPALARSLGFSVRAWHFATMSVLALVIVAVFEAAGVILPVAMLIVPGMFAAQLSNRMVPRMAWSVLHALLSALLGYHLSVWLDCSPAGAMVVVGAVLFVAVWVPGMIRSAWMRAG
jgi:manganese/zinc/iron transport system permease protein